MGLATVTCKLRRRPYSHEMIKWMAWLLAALFLALVTYSSSALISLERLVAAARASNGAEVIARTSVPRVRHAVISQIVSAYLERLGKSVRCDRSNEWQ